MFRDIKLVIYDLDGVLIDSNRAIVESFRRTFSEIDEPFDPEQVLCRIGVGLHQIFREILPESYEPKIEELRLCYIRHFQSLDINYIRTLDGVLETLERVQRLGYLQAVATNKTVTEAERILRELGVTEFFDLMTGFMTVPRAKPAPDMILYLLEKLEVEPSEAVFVDDTSTGLMAGITAGVHTVGISTGNNTVEQIMSVKPEVVIDHISELLDLLG